jgi:glucosamine-6-phosphate deaminase
MAMWIVPGTIERGGRELSLALIDLAFVGSGENGYLAFHDPPADVEIENPYLLVDPTRTGSSSQSRVACVADASRVAGDFHVSSPNSQIG